MNRRFPLLCLVAVMLSGWAYSHAKMSSTVPADGDFVSAPDNLLKNVAGEKRDLGTFPAELAKTFSINVPQPLRAGEYYVVWRSIAADSHFSTGEFFFTVVAD